MKQEKNQKNSRANILATSSRATTNKANSRKKAIERIRARDGKRQVQDAPLSEIAFMQAFATNKPPTQSL
jgi:hypothetical protein